MTDERRKEERRGKAPAFQFYAKDWLVDTAHLSLEEQGAYIRLLSHQWVSETLPHRAADKARLLRIGLPSFQRLWKRLAEYFPHGKNPRLERVRAELQAYRERQAKAGQRGADRRWHSAANGEPMAPPMANPSPNHGSASAPSLTTNTANDDEPIYDSEGRPSAALQALASDLWPRSRGKRS